MSMGERLDRQPFVPWLGARKMARVLLTQVEALRTQRDDALKKLEELGALSVLQLQAQRLDLEREIEQQRDRLIRERADAEAVLQSAKERLEVCQKAIV